MIFISEPQWEISTPKQQNVASKPTKVWDTYHVGFIPTKKKNPNMNGSPFEGDGRRFGELNAQPNTLLVILIEYLLHTVCIRKQKANHCCECFLITILFEGLIWHYIEIFQRKKKYITVNFNKRIKIFSFLSIWYFIF